MLKNILGGDLEPGLNYFLPREWCLQIEQLTRDDPDRQLDSSLPKINFDLINNPDSFSVEVFREMCSEITALSGHKPHRITASGQIKSSCDYQIDYEIIGAGVWTALRDAGVGSHMTGIEKQQDVELEIAMAVFVLYSYEGSGADTDQWIISENEILLRLILLEGDVKHFYVGYFPSKLYLQQAMRMFLGNKRSCSFTFFLDETKDKDLTLERLPEIKIGQLDYNLRIFEIRTEQNDNQYQSRKAFQVQEAMHDDSHEHSQSRWLYPKEDVDDFSNRAEAEQNDHINDFKKPINDEVEIYLEDYEQTKNHNTNMIEKLPPFWPVLKQVNSFMPVKRKSEGQIPEDEVFVYLTEKSWITDLPNARKLEKQAQSLPLLALPAVRNQQEALAELNHLCTQILSAVSTRQQAAPLFSWQLPLPRPI